MTGAAYGLERGWKDPRDLLGPEVLLADEARLAAAEARITADARISAGARMAVDARMAEETARAAANADYTRIAADTRADIARSDAARISADARMAAEAARAASNIRADARDAASAGWAPLPMSRQVPLTARGLGLTGGPPMLDSPPPPHPLRAHLPHRPFGSEAVFTAGAVAADAVAETNVLRDAQAQEHFRRIEADEAAEQVFARGAARRVDEMHRAEEKLAHLRDNAALRTEHTFQLLEDENARLAEAKKSVENQRDALEHELCTSA